MRKILGSLPGAIQRFVQRFLRPLIVAIFGEIQWSPPRWLGSARDPRWFWTAVAIVVVVLASSLAGWNWYRHRPKPHTLSVTGTWPRPTRLEKDATPDRLVIQFSGSAALLPQVGKEVKSGITTIPPLDGKWEWRSDSSLVFTPKADWEVGKKYTITFDRHLFPAHVLLSSYSYEFQSPAFAASIDQAQFYDDPTNPKIKKVVATARFTHPVDKADFETLRARGCAHPTLREMDPTTRTGRTFPERPCRHGEPSAGPAIPRSSLRR
jgi:hypothetical protein